MNWPLISLKCIATMAANDDKIFLPSPPAQDREKRRKADCFKEYPQTNPILRRDGVGMGILQDHTPDYGCPACWPGLKFYA